jgi:hypothetical protein
MTARCWMITCWQGLSHTCPHSPHHLYTNTKCFSFDHGYGSASVRHYVRDEMDWRVIFWTIDTLRLAAYVNLLWQGGNYPTASLFMPSLRALLDGCDDEPVDPDGELLADDPRYKEPPPGMLGVRKQFKVGQCRLTPEFSMNPTLVFDLLMNLKHENPVSNFVFPFSLGPYHKENLYRYFDERKQMDEESRASLYIATFLDPGSKDFEAWASTNSSPQTWHYHIIWYLFVSLGITWNHFASVTLSH